MLTQLHIQNVAVIQKASIPLEQGLNVFTGETGAGKTILLAALDAVLGERTSRDIIRTGEEKAQVSAMFEDISPQARAVLEEMGFDAEDGSLLIFREMTAAGKNTCRINGMPATVSMLKAISDKLIHIHGQRDGQALLSPERHLDMIDEFGELQEVLAAYRELYRKRKAIQEELDALNMNESEKAQRMDMLRFQIEEIESAKLEDEGEEEALAAQRKVIQGSERIRQGLAEAYTALRGEDEIPGIDELVSQLSGGLGEVARFVDNLAAMAQRAEEIGFELQDMASDISDALEELEFDPGELDRIEYRLDTIYKLKRKYGEDIPAILAHCREAVEELDSITMSGQRTEALQKQLAEVTAACMKQGKALSAKRTKAAKDFIAQVEEELAFLDMPNVKLSVSHTVHDLGQRGIDDMQFLIVTNPGEEPKPLSRIASGGEMARIMLSIKNVLAHRDDIDTLVFDEVDTGVSGRAAGKIGRKLAQVSRSRQVICVTHLAQVAAFADNHLYIAKEVEEGRTYTIVSKLDHEAAIAELARITSGEVITPAALESAGELWQRAHTTQE
ncbi:MAG: DNA repair protein RecN [Oscillospiraceae bacterium]